MDDTTGPRQVAATDADAAAREFRASLEQRREDLDAAALALEAGQRKRVHADDLVRHAEALADRIETEARERAEQIVADAQARADRTIADAEAARAALLEVIDRARTDLTSPTGPTEPTGSTSAPSAGVDLLFGAVEATTRSSPPRRPAWP